MKKTSLKLSCAMAVLSLSFAANAWAAAPVTDLQMLPPMDPGTPTVCSGGTAMQMLVYSGDATPGNSAINCVNVTSDSGANLTVGGNLNVGGSETVTGNETVNGTVTTMGDNNVVGNSSVGGNANISGAETVTGNASIGGSETVTGNVTVGGTVSIGGPAVVGSACSPNGTLGINGIGKVLNCVSGVWVALGGGTVTMMSIPWATMSSMEWCCGCGHSSGYPYHYLCDDGCFNFCQTNGHVWGLSRTDNWGANNTCACFD